MKNILIVEDEEDLSSVVGSVFSDEGYNVRTLQSAEEALRFCGQCKPDLIICDVKMGEMDGFTMLEIFTTSFWVTLRQEM
jgi:CheY-like chemotaxis protein